jgi:protocatechuate 3,4-dioxygenase beta subunit
MVLVFLLLLSPSPTLAQGPQKCAIDGSVLSAESGQPLNKARVLLRRNNYSEPVAVAATDSQGRFFLAGLAPGRYLLEAERNGYLTASYAARTPGFTSAGMELMPGQHLRDVVLRMHPYGVISGRITDEDGEPVEGVPVLLVGYRYRMGVRRVDVRATGRTNDLGQYRFGNLAPGKYVVTAGDQSPISRGAVDSEGRRLSDEGVTVTFYPRSTDIAGAVPIELASGTRAEGIDISLRRARMATLSGRANLANQERPNRSVQIHLSSPGNPLVSMNTSAREDLDGSFELRGVPPGLYIIHADYEAGGGKSLSAAQSLTVTDSDVEGIRLVVGPGIEVTGRVHRDGDAPMEFKGLQVWIEQVDRSSVDPGKVEPDGRFSLTGVRPDWYVFGLAGLPESAYLKAVRVGEVEVTEPNLNLFQPLASLDVLLGTDAARVEGVVVDGDHQPVGGVTVLLAPDERRAFRRFATARTDSYGHYVFKSVAPGDYRLFCFPSLDLEDGIYFDPAFLPAQEGVGEALKVGPNARVTNELKLNMTAAK